MKVVYLNKKAKSIDKEKEALIESLRYAYLRDRRKSYIKYKNRLDAAGISEERFMRELEEQTELLYINPLK